MTASSLLAFARVIVPYDVPTPYHNQAAIDLEDTANAVLSAAGLPTIEVENATGKHLEFIVAAAIRGGWAPDRAEFFANVGAFLSGFERDGSGGWVEIG